MNLFDYIADKLQPEQKRELYKEKAVCLCLFRVALSNDQDLTDLSQYIPPGLLQ